MKPGSLFYLWFLGVLSQFIEGAADSFLIVAGGSTVAQMGTSAPAVTFHQLLVSMFFGGGIYAASYLKKNPLPTGPYFPAAIPAAPTPVS